MQTTLKIQLVVSTVLIILSFYLWSWTAAPARMFGFVSVVRGRNYAFGCLTIGLVCGVAIGFVTEYYTSHSYSPVQEVARSCETGAATNIIYGLALGHQSVVFPVIFLTITAFLA